MQALIDNSEQGTREWRIARMPYVTASDVAKAMAKGSGATRANYMAKMLCEELSGQPVNGYKSSFMQNGNDHEPIARRAYELITGKTVQTVGFAYLPDERLGASSDGLVDDDGEIEIKNVIPAEQIRMLTTRKIKSEYLKQIQTQLYVYDRKWCDFISQSLGDDEYGRLPDHLRYCIIRVERDEETIAEIRKEVAKFHAEKDALKLKLQSL